MHKPRRSHCFFVVLLACTGVAAAEDEFRTTTFQRDDTKPLSPSEQEASIEVRNGFRLELVACEPLLKDPVAIDWDIHGRLWVAEMADYPLGMDGQGQPGGRVRVLEDTDADGRYDESTLFLDGLSYPTGIVTWRDGVLVTAAPDIIYAEDTDHDGRADKRETLYSGFNQGNQQLRVNGLRWGLDNWIYCASGSHHSGYGQDTGVTAVATGQRVTVGSRDFRIRPDQHLLDPQSGPSQFGRNRDDWGNWFGVQNSYPLRHYVLADHDIRRNPYFAPPDPRIDLTESNPTVYPIKRPQKRYHSFENATQFTSACSGIVYRDTMLFPDSLATGNLQHSFTCAPFHSLVQHNLLRESGTSFELSRDPQENEREFFASRDRWCRPVMVRTGPDGALWIVDMYRYMIEHPAWVNQAARAELRPYYRHGEDQGRVWRVFPADSSGTIPKLAALAVEQLVDQLENPNGWIRDKCQQLLIRRSDPQSVVPLRDLARRSEYPLARLHAICTLDGLMPSDNQPALDTATLWEALRDAHPGIRRHSVRLAGERVVSELLDSLLTMFADTDAKVRLQLASSLGHFNNPRVGDALARLLTDSRSDIYIRAAAMSSISGRNVSDVLSSIVAEPVQQDVLRDLCRVALASELPNSIDVVIEAIAEDRHNSIQWRFGALAALLDVVPLHELPSRAHADTLSALLVSAEQVVGSSDQPEAMRLTAMQLVARGETIDESTLETARLLTSPQQPPAIQSAIVNRLATRTETIVADQLLDNWQTSSPTLRSQIISVLLSREQWTDKLMKAIGSRHILASDLGIVERQQLLNQDNDEMVARVKASLDDDIDADRQAVIEEYRRSFQLTPNVATGAKVFEKNCANCHRLDGVGKDIGPNLKSLTNKSRTALLASILDPNAAVEAKYVTYAVIDKDGRGYSGLIKTETAANITLVAVDGKHVSILRSNIDDFASTGRSPMPEGLEKELSLQDMADLLAYLQRVGEGSSDTLSD